MWSWWNLVLLKQFLIEELTKCKNVILEELIINNITIKNSMIPNFLISIKIIVPNNSLVFTVIFYLMHKHLTKSINS